MRCPFCSSLNNKVIDSRPSRDERSIRRRRHCDDCDRRFTTREAVERLSLQVKKRDGSLEDYDRNKLLAGVRLACTKRPVSVQQLDSVTDQVEAYIHSRATKEVTSREIGERVMAELRALDEVAYVRYASVYRRFEDAGEFTEEVRKLS
ncbi:MAG: Transcriptional repressor NrdR [Calditrichaeota bacterium]|nr:Transcriptional repressor NrdR [Calditrichota bacterium]